MGTCDSGSRSASANWQPSERSLERIFCGQLQRELRRAVTMSSPECVGRAPLPVPSIALLCRLAQPEETIPSYECFRSPGICFPRRRLLGSGDSPPGKNAPPTETDMHGMPSSHRLSSCAIARPAIAASVREKYDTGFAGRMYLFGACHASRYSRRRVCGWSSCRFGEASSTNNTTQL
jgi:hypothetical protein